MTARRLLRLLGDIAGWTLVAVLVLVLAVTGACCGWWAWQVFGP